MSIQPRNVSHKLYAFINDLVDNRVFDVYLKYLGITTLNSATLVPIALILGNDVFKQYVKSMKNGQIGGNFRLPVIDRNDIGTYLKLIGLYHLNLTPHTLIPLGVLMTLYEINKSNLQLGGGKNPINIFSKFAKKLVGNRVLDLYLKYKGITTLNSYTLVPIALILGVDAMKDYLKNTNSISTPTTIEEQMKMKPRQNKLITQMGGKVELPLLDDPLVGNYLKLAGLYHLPLTTNTLVPLGIIMVVYNLYLQGNQ